jgi:tetrahydromethanopterin S-methyltransferase subunit G
MIMDYRQQGQGQFFPGFPGGGGGGGINSRLDQLERQIERLDRKIDQQDRRLDHIERRLGLRQGTEYTEYYY